MCGAIPELMQLVAWLLHPEPEWRCTLKNMVGNAWLHQPCDLSEYKWEQVVPESEYKQMCCHLAKNMTEALFFYNKFSIFYPGHICAFIRTTKLSTAIDSTLGELNNKSTIEGLTFKEITIVSKVYNEYTECRSCKTIHVGLTLNQQHLIVLLRYNKILKFHSIYFGRLLMAIICDVLRQLKFKVFFVSQLEIYTPSVVRSFWKRYTKIG